MNKLYVFGIGGTGSRVLRSLTMLLAAGVESTHTIVPIIIDPDKTAADLTRTVKLMEEYRAIREKLTFTNKQENKFFKTEILNSVNGFKLPLNNATSNYSFEKYINLDGMSDQNKALINMLYSRKDLNSNMQVGFKGNPNIGSVVLNQFSNSEQFENFANSFQKGDKIFIISSIFGGTGASGFPLLAKILRTNSKIPNHALINNAEIGAITVLPYFILNQNSDSAINSDTFISKTKSALSYYLRNISEPNTLNTLYYVADTISNTYTNAEGGYNQKNDAHLIELISALSILDFASTYNNTSTTIHKEYGVKQNSEKLIFEDLGDATQQLIKKPLTQFVLLSEYLTKVYDHTEKQPWAKNMVLDNDLKTFTNNIKSFQQEFISWLIEMQNNKRSFNPFNFSETRKGLFDIVQGVKPNKIRSFYSNFDLFDSFLNKQKIDKSTRKEQQFLELFFKATEKLVKGKFNF